tara:strand:- start:307 stop:945 length:639 start_codon:yes stop_codon:yes gene_type:complete
MALNEIIYELINEVNNNNDDISQRELSILNIFKNKLDCTEINFEELIGIIRENGHVWRNIISNFPKSVPINNPINLISMKNYIIYQTKEYPYTILVRFVDNHLELTYIENKDSIPSFTINNPPRKNKNYIYICGIDIYNGYLLTSSTWQDNFSQYYSRDLNLRNEFNNNDILIIPSHGVELNDWIEHRGTKFYRENINDSLPLIVECFSRYL